VLATRVPVGVYETDREGRCTFVNLRWSEIAGLAWDEALGLGWLAAVHPEDREEVRARWQAAVAASSSFSHEFRFRSPDGKVAWVSCEAIALGDESGHSLGYLGTVIDVTERHQAVLELERSNADLEQFAYVASHDLSEPLRVIGGFVELLQHHYADVLDDDGRRFVANALSGVARMQALIDDLLAYSRVGRAELVRSEVDVGALVADLIAMLEASRRDAGARIVIGDLPTLRAEPSLLERVFQNLLSNAFKFAGPDPRIEIGAERVEGAWRLWIADDGPGIRTDQVERSFEMFQRLHGRDIPGTGIGLPICKRIVERHGGTISYRRADGGGSVFRFTIPD
jgi:PAS domain S-box-containing protein